MTRSPAHSHQLVIWITSKAAVLEKLDPDHELLELVEAVVDAEAHEALMQELVDQFTPTDEANDTWEDTLINFLCALENAIEDVPTISPTEDTDSKPEATVAPAEICE